MQNHDTFNVQIGPERIVLTDALQPFAFKGDGDTLVVQGQLSFPPGYVPPAKNSFPGIVGVAVTRNNGDTWQRWKPAPEQGMGPVIEGSATLLRDGTILVLEWIADVPDESGLWRGQIWESADNFETLQGPFQTKIDLPLAKSGFDDGGHPYAGVTFHRSLLELPDGALLASVYCWFEGDDTPCPYMPSMNKFRTVVLRSEDRGRSWKYVATVAVDPAVGEEGFNEPVIARISQGPHAGRLVCVMRTGAIDCALHQAHSDDDGATWSTPRALEMHGVDPDLKELHDGTLVCSFGRRMNIEDEKRRYYLAISRDSGDSWSQVVPLPPIEEHAQTFPGGCWGDNSTETHYTSIIETAPGQLLYFYDIGFWSATVRYIATRTISIVRS